MLGKYGVNKPYVGKECYSGEMTQAQWRQVFTVHQVKKGRNDVPGRRGSMCYMHRCKDNGAFSGLRIDLRF